MITSLTILFCIFTMFVVSILKRKFLEPLAIPLVGLAQFWFVFLLLTNIFDAGLVQAMLYSMLSLWGMYGLWIVSAIKAARRRR